MPHIDDSGIVSSAPPTRGIMPTARLSHCYHAIHRSLQAIPPATSNWVEQQPSDTDIPDMPLYSGECQRLDQPTDPSALTLHNLQLQKLLPPRLPSPPRQPLDFTPLTVARRHSPTDACLDEQTLNQLITSRRWTNRRAPGVYDRPPAILW
eukprot:GHVS01071426.1.p1 GENE.GHVS01071426.1~~GHVS01071426.1.p1  ORF type:complete len:151 (+),score=16.45 GHVS01071426.1:1166-1618(+)